MTQEIGETRDAIIEDDNKKLQEIIDANKNRQEPYWIVLFAKRMKSNVDGKPTLVKHIKAYGKKPSPQVGMITGEVNNKTGEIKWDINMPQVPIDYNAAAIIGGKPCDKVITETTSIPGAYITQ